MVGVFVNVKLRKWGNSLGAVIPKDVVADARLKANDQVLIKIESVRANLGRELFGTLKFKHSAQEIKDEARKGWGE